MHAYCDTLLTDIHGAYTMSGGQMVWRTHISYQGSFEREEAPRFCFLALHPIQYLEPTVAVFNIDLSSRDASHGSPPRSNRVRTGELYLGLLRLKMQIPRKRHLSQETA